MGEITVVIGTQNRDKGREIMAHLAGLPVRLRGLWEWADAPDVEETGDTLEANAILKATGYHHSDVDVYGNLARRLERLLGG